MARYLVEGWGRIRLRAIVEADDAESARDGAMELTVPQKFAAPEEGEWGIIAADPEDDEAAHWENIDVWKMVKEL